MSNALPRRPNALLISLYMVVVHHDVGKLVKADFDYAF